MPKIDVNQVAEILKRNDIDPALLRQIVEEMNQAVEPELDEEKPPAVKKQAVKKQAVVKKPAAKRASGK